MIPHDHQRQTEDLLRGKRTGLTNSTYNTTSIFPPQKKKNGI